MWSQLPRLSARQEFLVEAEPWLDQRGIAAIIYGDDFTEDQLKVIDIAMTALRKKGLAFALGTDVSDGQKLRAFIADTRTGPERRNG